MTFAAIDYLMSLDPYWYSTVYGFMIVMGQTVTAMSVAIAILTLARALRTDGAPGYTAAFARSRKLLLAIVMLWAYVNFSQLLITWSGNLPRKSLVYQALERRLGMGWADPAHRALRLPFPLLLSQDLKKNPEPSPPSPFTHRRAS